MSDIKKKSRIGAQNLEPLDESADLAKKFGHVNEEDTQELKINDKREIENIEDSKESNKETFGEMTNVEKDDNYQRILTQAKKTTNDDNQDTSSIKSDAEKVSQQIDVESQVQNLVDLAVNKSVVYAVNVARHLEDNYVLDKLHDTLLSEELHKSLLKKGLIKDD